MSELHHSCSNVFDNNPVANIKPPQIARDLMEDGRCERSLSIADSFGMSVSDSDPLWKDRTFLELNYAVSSANQSRRHFYSS